MYVKCIGASIILHSVIHRGCQDFLRGLYLKTKTIIKTNDNNYNENNNVTTTMFNGLQSLITIRQVLFLLDVASHLT